MMPEHVDNTSINDASAADWFGMCATAPTTTPDLKLILPAI
jgi:hypothetical protein